ncbi:MAG TPA: LacI family DNA-binding transcriptional regulator [Candidatus Limnocylindrales bacterium]|nr:LacI family DNA-binding transcriptional regulator [Candidatus Limnocylindrales bacterium]
MEPRTQRPRIADVAREAGVSKTAVSFAFNAPDRLAPETTERIRGVARRLGYTPHPVARMLTQRRTGTIGVLTPQALSVVFGNPFFGTFSSGVARVAEEYGYALHFISPFRGSLVGAMTRATVDGVIAVGLSEGHPEIEDIRRAGLPLVLVDSQALPEHTSIEVDDECGAREAAAYLAGLGHREVLVLGVEPPSPGAADPEGVTARRLRGYRAGFGDVGVEITDDHVINGPATIDGGAEATRRAWDAGQRPTAILAMSDAIAVGAMRALREFDRDVPDDVSVVGFDDVDLATHVEPALTTVHQPIDRKGEEAVRALVEVIEHRGSTRPEHRRLETRLIVRESTGPVADQGDT